MRGQRPHGDTRALVEELRDWVGEQVGAIAKPDNIRFADNLPKTRSGKIMRRLLRSIAGGEAITQDVSTLENPAIVDQLRGVATQAVAAVTRRVAARGKSLQRRLKRAGRRVVRTARRKLKRKVTKVKRSVERAVRRGPGKKPARKSVKRAAPRRAGASKSAGVRKRKAASGARRKRQGRARRR